jgi:hypothetical protein
MGNRLLGPRSVTGKTSQAVLNSDKKDYLNHNESTDSLSIRNADRLQPASGSAV